MSDQRARSDRARIWGRILRQERERRFLTQRQLSEAIVAAGKGKVTLNQSAVCRWERGDTIPALRYRPLIAKALDVDVDLLFPRLSDLGIPERAA